MNEQTRKTLFSSETDQWFTPQEFFEKLERVLGPFDLDPCADAANAKASLYYTKSDDGLSKTWVGRSAFVNPPYGREIGLWVQKAYEETRAAGTRAVMLIPSRTDTKYWHEYAMKADAIFFVRGRLKFGGAKNSAPFPSAVLVFDPRARIDQGRVSCDSFAAS